MKAGSVPGVSAPKASEAEAKPAPKAAPVRAPEVQAAPAEPLVRPVQETLVAIAAQIESFLRSSGRSLNFSVDASTGRTVIAVRDAAGTLIRQIPSEEALRLAASISARSGALLDTTA